MNLNSERQNARLEPGAIGKANNTQEYSCTTTLRYKPVRRPNDPDRALRALWAIPVPASRDEWWPIVGLALSEEVSEDEILAWCASGPGFNRSDALATIRSLARRPNKGSGSLYSLAKVYGWNEGGSSRRCKPVARRAPHKQPIRPFAFDLHALLAHAATTDQPYIIGKGGVPDGLYVFRGPQHLAGERLDGALIVPAHDLDGRLSSAQFILPNGRKLNAPGCRMAGMFTLGNLNGAQRAYIVEGIGQAWTCYQTTGQPAVVAFG